MVEQLSLAEMDAIAVRMGDVPEGYPSADLRLRIGDVAVADGGLIVPSGPWHIADHPNHRGADPDRIDIEVPSTEMAIMPAGLSEMWQAEGILLDQYGRPIHPHWYQLLSDPRTALPTGRGYFYRYGPNMTVDSFIYRWQPDGTPEVLLIRRRKGRAWALPGGFVDREDESPIFGARREVGEETGLREIGGTDELIIKILPIGRLSVLHAWTVNQLFLIRGNQKYLHDVEPVAGDDAIDVGWFPPEAIEQLEIFDEHPAYITAGLRRILAAA